MRQIPLPGGLVPGEYRVVRSDGRVLRIELTDAELARRGLPKPKTAVDFQMLHDGQLRWYFIRIERARIDPAGQTADSVPPVVARKPRRRAGYVRGGASIPGRRAGCVRGGASIPGRRVVLAMKPSRRDTGWRFGGKWIDRLETRLRAARNSVTGFPALAGRLWWRAVRESFDRWKTDNWNSAQTAGESQPERK